MNLYLLPVCLLRAIGARGDLHHIAAERSVVAEVMIDRGWERQRGSAIGFSDLCGNEPSSRETHAGRQAGFRSISIPILNADGPIGRRLQIE